MLRLTKIEDGARTVIIVEGKLTGATLGSLVELMKGIPAGAVEAQPVVVDLMGVTSIDAAGKQLLKELHGRGATLRAKGCLNRAIVDGITCFAPEPAGAGEPPDQQARQSETK
jgi:anti-anti-sigma regulatory factor